MVSVFHEVVGLVNSHYFMSFRVTWVSYFQLVSQNGGKGKELELEVKPLRQIFQTLPGRFETKELKSNGASLLFNIRIINQLKR